MSHGFVATVDAFRLARRSFDASALHINVAEGSHRIRGQARRLRAANDFPSLLARVRAGAEVLIERNAETVAVLRAAEPNV
jgi:hypothetical protein